MDYETDSKGRRKVTRADKDSKRSAVMSPEQMEEANEWLIRLTQNQGYMQEIYGRWAKEDEAYKGDQPKQANRPNTRVNIINANIEGQVAMVVDQNLSAMVRGEAPGDEKFAEWARVGIEWALKKNSIKRIVATHERRRIKHGVGFFKVSWDADAFKKFGLAKLSVPPINKILVDGKIKDPLRFQEAEYVAEILRMSEDQIEDTYGEDYAEAVDYGRYYIEDQVAFVEEQTEDDDDGVTVLQIWSRHKGMLRVQEITACGVILYDSHKDKSRSEHGGGTHESYYDFVNDMYPYFMTVLYPEEGTIWGFGDCKLMTPLQNMINDLYDKIRLTAKPNMVLFDPDSEVDLSDFDTNSLAPVPCYKPNESVNSVSWGQVNESWWRLLGAIHEEVQRVTRFSALMTGGRGNAESATEAAIQQQQGNAATDHKKLMLQETLAEVCGYMLALMMQFYTEAKAFRLTDEKDKASYTWVDFREFTKVPVQIPATEGYIRQFMERNPGAETPKWQLLEGKGGKPETKDVDLDIQIDIGAGLPKNKAFLYQMTQQWAQTQVGGQPVMSIDEVRYIIKEFLGLPLNGQPPQMTTNERGEPVVAQPGMAQQGANVEGITANGRPAMQEQSGGGNSGNYFGTQPTAQGSVGRK